MLAGSAHAAVVTYIGSDNSVSSLAGMTNSAAARAAFQLAAPGLNTITFDTALPAGVTVSGGANATSGSICGAACGFNTTAGGNIYRSVSGGFVTFNFTTAIDSFGFYATGLQTELVPQQTVTFSDGSSQTINFPTSTSGGGAFIGFTDFGKSISSVSINLTNDIAGIDDVSFGVAAVPEPATWAMMLLGFGVTAGTLRHRRRETKLSFA